MQKEKKKKSVVTMWFCLASLMLLFARLRQDCWMKPKPRYRSVFGCFLFWQTKQTQGTDAKLRFAVAEAGSEIADSIRGFLNQHAQPAPEVVLLDIPNARKFVLRNAEVSADWVASVAAQFLDGKLTGTKSIKVCKRKTKDLFCLFY
jgi:hypothetical protein